MTEGRGTATKPENGAGSGAEEEEGEDAVMPKSRGSSSFFKGLFGGGGKGPCFVKETCVPVRVGGARACSAFAKAGPMLCGAGVHSGAAVLSFRCERMANAVDGCSFSACNGGRGLAPHCDLKYHMPCYIGPPMGSPSYVFFSCPLGQHLRADSQLLY